MVVDVSNIRNRVYGRDERVYPKEDVIQILYENLVPVVDKDYDECQNLFDSLMRKGLHKLHRLS